MRAGAFTLMVLAASSASQPVSEDGPGSPQDAPAVVVRSCCSDDDAELAAQQQAYEKTPASERPAEIAAFPFRINSGITVRDRMVISDPTAWSKIWLNIVAGHSPTPPLPAVDFDRETIVLAAMGQ